MVKDNILYFALLCLSLTLITCAVLKKKGPWPEHPLNIYTYNGYKPELERLARAVHDEDDVIHDDAIERLTKFGELGAQALIIQIRGNHSYLDRSLLYDDAHFIPNSFNSDIVEGLAKIGQLAVPSLIEVLYDDEVTSYFRPCHRIGAAKALGQIGDPTAVPALTYNMFNSHFDGEDEAAAEALGQIDDPAVVPALIKALPSNRAAVKALGQIGDPAALPALIGALRNRWVCKDAAWALGRIGDSRAVPALIEALEDEDSEVREAADKALEKIRTSEP